MEAPPQVESLRFKTLRKETSMKLGIEYPDMSRLIAFLAFMVRQDGDTRKKLDDSQVTKSIKSENF